MPSFCEHCGAPVNDEANFCSYCGHRLERDAEPAFEQPEEPVRVRRRSSRREFDPRRILSWLKSSDPDDDYLEVPDEEDGGSFGYEESFGQPEPDPEEETYGFEETMGSDDYIRKWDQVLEAEEDEDPYDDDFDHSIYDRHNNFLRKVAVICLTIIALVAGGFLLISSVAGRSTDEEPGPDDEALEALKADAYHFFLDVKDMDEESLATYEGMDFGRYDEEEGQFEEDLSLFLFYTRYSDMTIQEVVHAHIQGSLGLVEFEIDGPEDAVALFRESQFRLDNDRWRFDFASFVRQVRGDGPELIPEEPGEEPSEPSRDVEADEIAITRTAQEFNTAYHRFVNSADTAVRNHLLPGSSAVDRLNATPTEGISHERLELNLSNVSVRDERGSIQVSETFRRTENGTVTLVEYTWRYDLTLSNNQWLIDHYTRLSSSVQEVKPEQSPPDEPAGEEPSDPVVIPEGFTSDGTITGGTESTGNEVREMRYSPENHRLVLDLFRDGAQAETPVRFELKKADGGVILTLWGVDRFSAVVPELGAGQPVSSIEKPVKTTDGYRMEIRLAEGAAYNAFGLNRAEGRPARIVLDFVKP